MSEKLKKENKELQEKVDFLTSEIKEIKETLKLVSSKEREIKKTLKEKKLESKDSESFVEKILRADGDCEGNNLLKDLTKDYLIEFICDMRVAEIFFSTAGIRNDGYIPDFSRIKEVNNDKFHPHYRSMKLAGQTLKIEEYPKLFDVISRMYKQNDKILSLNLPNTNRILMKTDRTGKFFVEYNFLVFGYNGGDIETGMEEINNKYFLYPINRDPNKDYEFTASQNGLGSKNRMAIYNDLSLNKLAVKKIAYMSGHWRLRY